ncbi:hypothetical protein SEA_LEOPARD_90 [Mycobacterium phage Leopard]|uniref:Uncharacterized protein n=1 Tax=Mycobacterium phage Onyinye TaxID=2686235 RepID=A0A6B9LI40_9CAUD|nr:hypothetical protein PP339_gp090 [Mycobacterium phage Onyinye]QHB37494.1 hypothetical protein SEA_ONYINYE_90 [Mycobacterium phage Onyinye]UOW92966.1 hypothetical protein SEA_LEOPARD_90 [Mycobacterium phage Leopard]WKW85253.1 hypothetical protein SEA_AIKOY__91 [Mycobacterium phage Aikoy]
MADERTWEERLKGGTGPFIGHPMLPIPLRDNRARTERVSTYVELGLLRFFEQYCARGGFRSVSEVVRRLAILGAVAEGYEVEGSA